MVRCHIFVDIPLLSRIWPDEITLKVLSGPVHFSSMAYFYYKNGEDMSFDLVEYPVIPYPDPVSFSVFPLE